MIIFHKAEGKRAGKAGEENWRKVITNGFDMHHIGFIQNLLFLEKRR